MSVAFTEADVRMSFKRSNRPETAAYASDMTAIRDVTKLINGVLGIANARSDGKFAMFTAIGNKVLVNSEFIESRTDSPVLKKTNFVTGVMLKTAGMASVASYTSPGKAALAITLITAEKTILAARLTDIDKCRLATASLVATGGMAGLSCVSTGAVSLGISCFIGVVAVASDLLDVHAQCRK